MRGGIAIVGVHAAPRGSKGELDLLPAIWGESENASGKQGWDLFVSHYGPSKSLAASLDDSRRAELERDFVAWHETFKKGLGYEQPRQYVITRGRRR